ncbi:hypothetical protein HPT27_02115 [Permianibacter sp. IMCC34836]|uniref:chemotaxis protein CheB n=1 Tax=Permianibacter fluminis TaxID=2738515 RepID=UPI001553E272|nr:chemotaxis protein CheB [Permianibacter fluminis]NQD35798.1 hypothetical protein [Permianibacter fluminis]
MKSQALRIGLIGSGDDSSSKLLRLLAEQGMQVVHALLPKDLTDAHIAATDLDVWLLDLDDNHWHDQLDELMDRSSVPIFFNEHQAIESQQHLDYWCRNLISRMFELVADVPGLPPVASAPAAAASRSGETVHIAFPASAQKKSESKPSDELTPAPAALDPDLLQEIEELEQLLQTPTKQQEVLPDLDDSLPLPAAQDDFIFTPAATAKAPPAPPKPAPTAATAPAEKPVEKAVEKTTEKAAEKISEKAAEQTTKTPAEKPASTATPVATADSAAKPLDPVAAAKERAAKIKQQAAANLGKAAPAALTEAAPVTPAASTPISAADSAPKMAPAVANIAASTVANAAASTAHAVPATPAKVTAPATATTASTATPTATPVASKLAPAPLSAPTAPANTSVVPASTTAVPEKALAASQAAVASTQTTVSISTPATKPSEQKVADQKTAEPKAPEQKTPEQKTPEAKAGSNVTLDITALEPVVSPPEKHDWPTFPAPAAERGAQQLAIEADTADFAPIQPQPASGPMREPARPLAVVPGSAAAAHAKPTIKATESKAAPESDAAGHKPMPAAGSYVEPVPTLTPAHMADMEFEAVDFEPAADELEPHADFDVPMLESVASANASEFEAVTDMPPALPCDLWVLGASLGGPAALKRFFTALDQPLPICFLLAQHIDAHFLPVLGKILEQANPFYAVQVLARPGLIEPGSLLLAPIEKRLRFLDAGQIVHSGKSWTPPYSPCIDDVLSDVAAAYPGQVHAIVFSGMGEDGVDGARAIRDGQGQIWVQEAESCASSVMPDAIHQAGLAHQRATPEQLATRLMARYRQSADSKNLA